MVPWRWQPTAPLAFSAREKSGEAGVPAFYVAQRYKFTHRVSIQASTTSATTAHTAGPFRSVGLSANRAGVEKGHGVSPDQSPLSRRPIEPRRPSLSLTTLVRRAGKPASEPVGPSAVCSAELPFGWTAAAFRPAALCVLSFPLLLVDGAPPSGPVAAGARAGAAGCRAAT